MQIIYNKKIKILFSLNIHDNILKIFCISSLYIAINKLIATII